MKMLQKYKHVPSLYGHDSRRMYMEKYDNVLNTHGAGNIDDRFAISLFEFLDNLHYGCALYHGNINPAHICFNDINSWALVDWSSPDFGSHSGSLKASIKGDVYAATMTLVEVKTGQPVDHLHQEVHDITEGILCAYHMKSKPWSEILRNL